MLIKTKIILLSLVAIIVAGMNFTLVDPDLLGSKVIGEGTVEYLMPAHTHEISNHAGNVLKNPKWIIPPKTKQLFVFLEPDSVIKLYKNNLVHIEGLPVSIPGRKINQHTYRNPYDVIIVDTIYSVNTRDN